MISDLLQEKYRLKVEMPLIYCTGTCSKVYIVHPY